MKKKKGKNDKTRREKQSGERRGKNYAIDRWFSSSRARTLFAFEKIASDMNELFRCGHELPRRSLACVVFCAPGYWCVSSFNSYSPVVVLRRKSLLRNKQSLFSRVPMDGWISLTNLELYTALVDLLICSLNNRMIELHHVVGYWNGKLTKLLSLRTLLHHHVEIFHFSPFACNKYYFWIWINLFSIFNVSNMKQSMRTVIAKLHRKLSNVVNEKKIWNGGSRGSTRVHVARRGKNENKNTRNLKQTFC